MIVLIFLFLKYYFVILCVIFFKIFKQSIVSMNPRECILLFKDAVKSPNRFKQLEKNLERLNLPKLVLEIDIPSNECFLSLNEFFDETYNKFKGKII